MKDGDPERIGDLIGAVRASPALEPDRPNQGEVCREAPRSPTENRRTQRRLWGIGEGELPALISAIWPQLVGPEVAAHARPLHYRAGRLVVSTSSSAWAQTLHLMSEDIRARLEASLGPGRVVRITFRHAGWEEVQVEATCPTPEPQPTAAATASSRLTSPQEEALQNVEELDLPPDLKARIQSAMRAAFVREEKDSVR